jgi:hypothetical protein
MRILLLKASQRSFTEEREWKSLDDLVALMDEFRQSVIIDDQLPVDSPYDLRVRIYDDYVE